MKITKSKLGDTWDLLSKLLYGDERFAYLLLKANPKHMNYVILPSGLDIVVPEIPPEKRNFNSPKSPFL